MEGEPRHNGGQRLRGRDVCFVDSGEFPYCVFGRWFCTGNVLRRCICGMDMPKPVVVIAGNTLIINDQRVACLASERIEIDGDERSGAQFYSARQRDAAFHSNDQLGIRKTESDRCYERLAEVL